MRSQQIPARDRRGSVKSSELQSDVQLGSKLPRLVPNSVELAEILKVKRLVHRLLKEQREQRPVSKEEFIVPSNTVPKRSVPESRLRKTKNLKLDLEEEQEVEEEEDSDESSSEEDEEFEESEDEEEESDESSEEAYDDEQLETLLTTVITKVLDQRRNSTTMSKTSNDAATEIKRMVESAIEAKLEPYLEAIFGESLDDESVKLVWAFKKVLDGGSFPVLDQLQQSEATEADNNQDFIEESVEDFQERLQRVREDIRKMEMERMKPEENVALLYETIGEFQSGAKQPARS